MHLPRLSRVAVAAMAALSLVACDGATSPPDDVSSRLELPASVIVAGDTVPLRVIATNLGHEQVIAGVGCGFGLDVEVRAPNGIRSFILRGTPSICPIFDSNVLEPGETDTVVVRWRAPSAAGTYSLTGGVQVKSGLRARSAPRMVLVH